MRWLFASLALFFVTGCGVEVKSCTTIFAYGLTIDVVDDSTGQKICDATVDVVDGAYSEQLTGDMGFNCSYVGAGERAGTYDITATATGYQSNGVMDVEVGEDECHVIGEQVTIRLTPTM